MILLKVGLVKEKAMRVQSWVVCRSSCSLAVRICAQKGRFPAAEPLGCLSKQVLLIKIKTQQASLSQS